MIGEIQKDMKRLASRERAKASVWFFKTGLGQYGEGDVFLGITVPEQRAVAKKYAAADFKTVQKLLNSKIHEHRQVGLLILVEKYSKHAEERKKIFDFYMKNTKRINNWDLVDLSCHKIVGNYLLNRNRQILYKLAVSKNLWERRIAIVSTAAFISEKDFTDTLRISEILLTDRHDLIHKAVGWMLREMGKRDEKELVAFLNKYYKRMPRTMLRYSIERLSESKKKHYMKK
jgi:3-methyladenine DNA glycosylase AlkD